MGAGSPIPPLSARLLLRYYGGMGTKVVGQLGQPTPRLSRNRVARLTGLSLSHISRVYSGKRKPSMRAAALIAEARRISLDQLWEELQQANG